MSQWIKWVTDEVSWAITMVGVIMIVYSVGSFLVHGSCDLQVVSTGITGIVALARNNKATIPEKKEEVK